MQLRSTHWSCSLALALSLCVMAACGDDDDSSDKTTTGGTGGAAAKGGSGGSKAGTGGTGGAKAGTGGSKAGTGGGGSGGTTPGGFMCLEDPPKDPVKCGGATCEAPNFGMNTCIVPCCVQEGGKEMCGSKSTAMGLTTECTLPAKVDPDCPQGIDDGNGGTLMGCCNASQKKCGIISTLRPGCVTSSMLVTLPNPLQDCTPPMEGADAGAPDAG